MPDQIHRTVKTVSPASEGLNILSAVRLFAKCLSQQIEVLRQVGFFNDGIIPDHFDQFFLGQDLIVVLDQHHEGLDHFWWERDLAFGAIKHQFRPVKPKVVKHVNAVSNRFTHLKIKLRKT